MTALTEGALDLSAKPYDSKPPSPVHSFTSDVDMRADRPPSAVSSDADDSGIMSPRKRPAPGSGFSSRGGSYSPRGYAGRSPRASPELSPASAGGSVGSTPRSSPATTASPTGHGIDCLPGPTSLTSPTSMPNNNNNNHPGSSPGLSPTGARPFKMYPFEPMPSMYSQLAAAAASQGMYGYSPSGPTPGMPAANLFDSAISFSSPIGQYLQQKKRRMEARDGRPTHAPLSPLSPTPPSGPPTSGGYTSGGDDDSSDGGLSGMHNGASGGRGSGGSGSGGDKKVIAVPDERKDEAYWERRRKNNEAAKRSRDARRAKEEEIALRAAFLEQENLKLRAQVAILKNETAKLHYMLYNRM